MKTAAQNRNTYKARIALRNLFKAMPQGEASENIRKAMEDAGWWPESIQAIGSKIERDSYMENRK